MRPVGTGAALLASGALLLARAGEFGAAWVSSIRVHRWLLPGHRSWRLVAHADGFTPTKIPLAIGFLRCTLPTKDLIIDQQEGAVRIRVLGPRKHHEQLAPIGPAHIGFFRTMFVTPIHQDFVLLFKREIR